MVGSKTQTPGCIYYLDRTIQVEIASQTLLANVVKLLRQWYDFRQSTESPSVPYEDVMSSDDGLKLYLNLIVMYTKLFNRVALTHETQAEYGFCFVDGCPIEPSATRQLLERIAFIRLTHYGQLSASGNNMSKQ